jgi:hypothetical protein
LLYPSGADRLKALVMDPVLAELGGYLQVAGSCPFVTA